ncbi:MAG: methyltransferase family protein [Candidatus Hodarchaeales archaeon]|jgi:protein-S-isoprenylcysteine O-methyltransferase Ste14
MNKELISPQFLNVGLLITIGIHFLVPIHIIVTFPYTVFGLILIPFGFLLNIWSVRELNRNNTTINFTETAIKLVISGPYSISRNPIYLSGVILSLGFAIFLGSLTMFLFPVALLLILNFIYIPIEETRLQEIFGEKYLIYKKKVRRWI